MWQLFAGVGDHFTKSFDALLGYRYLGYRFRHDNPVSDLRWAGRCSESGSGSSPPVAAA